MGEGAPGARLTTSSRASAHPGPDHQAYQANPHVATVLAFQEAFVEEILGWQAAATLPSCRGGSFCSDPPIGTLPPRRR